MDSTFAIPQMYAIKYVPVKYTMRVVYTIILRFLLIQRYVDARKLKSWRGPDSFLLGQAPDQRADHGITETEDGLFIFGGIDRSSGLYVLQIRQLSALFDFRNCGLL